MTTLVEAWSTDAYLPPDCDPTAIDPDVLEAAHLDASRIMFDLTRRKYPGVATDTYTPFSCHGTCWSGSACTNHRGIELPAQPVVSITSVTVDGETIDPSGYELRDKRYLRRVGPYSWPCGCDLDDSDRFVIVYRWGVAPDETLKRACGRLAWELALARTPNCAERCKLPPRVQNVTRAGVSFAIIDPLTIFDEGKTGIVEVDLIIKSRLFGEARRRPVVGIPGKGIAGSRT